MEEKKPRGRPRKWNAKRNNLTFRVTAQMRAALQARAETSGRSLSEEIEMVLEKVLFPISVHRSD